MNSRPRPDLGALMALLSAYALIVGVGIGAAPPKGGQSIPVPDNVPAIRP